MQRTLLRFMTTALAALALILTALPAPAAAVGMIGSVQGHVTSASGTPLANACVWFGPVHIARSDPMSNCTYTDASGFYTHSWINGPSTIPLTFEKDPTYAQKTISTIVNSDSPVVVDAVLDLASGAPPVPVLPCTVSTAGPAFRRRRRCVRKRTASTRSGGASPAT